MKEFQFKYGVGIPRFRNEGNLKSYPSILNSRARNGEGHHFAEFDFVDQLKEIIGVWFQWMHP
jgi:hypothetical protein